MSGTQDPKHPKLSLEAQQQIQQAIHAMRHPHPPQAAHPSLATQIRTADGNSLFDTALHMAGEIAHEADQVLRRTVPPYDIARAGGPVGYVKEKIETYQQLEHATHQLIAPNLPKNTTPAESPRTPFKK